MGVRYRRSVRIAPGIKLNVSKTGWGISAGGRGAHYSVHSSGRHTRSIHLAPGLSYTTTSTASSRAKAARASQAAGPPIDPARIVPKPGIFSSTADKAYYAAVLAYLRGDQLAALNQSAIVIGMDQSAVSAHLFAGVCANQLDDPNRAIAHLETVVAWQSVWPDKYFSKFLSSLAISVQVRITELITALPPFGPLGAALALAEMYQSAGRLEEAIGLVQQLHESMPGDSMITLSLADLLLADADYEGVLEVTAGTTNSSDTEVEILHVRGAALTAQGHLAPAIDAFRDALAKTAQRDPDLLNAVRYDRALTYERAGQKAKAKADLERLYAANPGYEDVRERLAALQ